MEYPPPKPPTEITSTLWINVSLYKNISIPQWDSMTKMIGQLIGDKTEVLLFGTAMADNVSIDFGITGVNMIELSTTLAKGAEAEKILGTASLVIERILKKNNNMYKNKYKITYKYQDKVSQQDPPALEPQKQKA
jgi:hypothetical protein